MKTAAMILHSLWGGVCSVFVLQAVLSDFSWSWAQAEPLIMLLIVVPAAWLVFTVGLLFDRKWAWFGSFTCTTFSLFAGVWVTMLSLDNRASFIWELVGTVVALSVLGLLLHTRGAFCSAMKNSSRRGRRRA